MDLKSPHLSASTSVQSLATQLQQAVEKLREQKPASSTDPVDSLLFVGNWQDAIPRAIWADPVLEAIDVRVWGFIRTYSAANNATVFPSYKLIAGRLNVARATVSRAIQILRACRWLTLCSCIRDKSGQFHGNVYALHDEPLTLHDGMHLDPEYLRFIQQLESHHHPRVARIAQAVLTTLKEHIGSGQDVLREMGTVSRFNAQVNGRSFAVSNTRVQLLNSVDPVQNLNLDRNHRVQKLNSDTRNQKKQGLNNQVQKLNLGPCSSCSSKNINNKTTTIELNTSARASAFDELVFPNPLSPDERELAFMYLKTFPQGDQQALLDELAAQIQSKHDTANPIRNPIGYLSWLCRQQERGKTALTSLGLKTRQRREQEQRQREQLEKAQQRMTEYANPRALKSPLAQRMEQLAERFAGEKDP